MQTNYFNKVIFIFLLLFISSLSYAETVKGVLSVKGFGTVDTSKTNSDFQAKMMAKRAAQLDAQRQLAETTKGLQLSAGSTVEDFEVTSDVIATRVKGLIKGAFIIKQSVKAEQGSFVAEVTLGICLTNESEVCKARDSIKLIGDSLSEK
ncbi:MAG: hypothetical protein COB35_02565 [Gammaproteobacteria bacterium]|nr:MAG: hypothetical protein COB35_02565 [Gammaproteobacteria bacterium]